MKTYTYVLALTFLFPLFLAAQKSSYLSADLGITASKNHYADNSLSGYLTDNYWWLNPNYALGFRDESLKCKENGSSTVLLRRRRGPHHGEHQKSWTFPLSKQFQLVIDILMHISG